MNTLKTFRTIILSLVLVKTGTSFSQVTQGHLRFEEISVEKGLSQRTVFCTVQDKYGYIWMGTRTGGLNKFDGYAFTQYNKLQGDTTSISGNEVTCLLEDSKGRLWVGTRGNGMNRFDHETELFKQYVTNKKGEFSLRNRTINEIAEDSNGTVWIATTGGLCYYDEEKDSFIQIRNNLRDDKSYGNVTALASVNEHLVVGMKREGLYFIDTNTKKAFRNLLHNEEDETSISENYISCLHFDAKERLWVGTRNKGLNVLFSLDSDEFTRFQVSKDGDGLLSNVIRAVHVYKENVWIGTKSGLSILMAESLQSDTPVFTNLLNDPFDNKSLSNNSIYSIMGDRDQNLWIGTWNGGVNFVSSNGKKFRHYFSRANDPSSLSTPIVSSFEWYQNQLIVGTENNGGVQVFDPKTELFSHLNDAVATIHVKGLLVDRDGDLWIGSLRGLYLYSTDKGTLSTLLEKSAITDLEEGKDGELWVATTKKLVRIDKRTQEQVSYTRDYRDSTSISNNFINTIFYDAKGQVWIGTKFGLNLYQRDTDSFQRFFHSPENDNTLSSNHISALSEDSEGILWVGTIDGLNRYDRSADLFSRYNRKDGIPDNVINNILMDDSSNLWVTTNRGVCKISVDDDQLLKVVSYKLSDGLQDFEFLMNASFKLPSGEMFFGGVNGYNAFFPDEVKSNPIKPTVAINQLKLYNEPVDFNSKDAPIDKPMSLAKKVTLNHQQSVMTFGFVALSYDSPEANQYAYKMEGFDADWNEAGTRREAYYSNLEAGTYTFKVRASNNDGVWSDEEASLVVRVLPPWWATWWFRGLVLLGLALAIFLVIQRKRNQIRNQKRQLQEKLDKAVEEVKNQNIGLNQEKENLSNSIRDTDFVIQEAVESGNFSARINIDNKEGQWKSLSESINRLFDEIVAPFRSINEIVYQMSSGDLSGRLDEGAKGDLQELATGFNKAVSKFGTLINSIKETAGDIQYSSKEMLTSSQEMTVGTELIASSIREVSTGAQEQVVKVEESLQAVEDIKKASEEMADKSEQINKVALEGVANSKQGKKLLLDVSDNIQTISDYSAKTNSSMASLKTRSKEIRRVLKVISGIANQTNLLALNAAIEAAKAGDAGQGFAVVADEIRKLAESSKMFNKEIDELVKTIDQDTENTAGLMALMSKNIETGVAASKQVAEVFEQIMSSSSTTFDFSEEILSSSTLQTKRISEIINAVAQVVVIAEETAAGSDQIASSAEELVDGMQNYKERSESMDEIAKVLIDEVEKFKLQTPHEVTEPDHETAKENAA